MAATTATLVGATCRAGDYTVVNPGIALSTVAGEVAAHVSNPANFGHIVDIFSYTGTSPILTVPVCKVSFGGG